MRRGLAAVILVLPVAACGVTIPESDDWSPAVIEADVVLWRLASGPAGFVGVGGQATADDFEEPEGPLTMSAYRSGDGIDWERTFTFGVTAGPAFSLTGSADRYAVAGMWSDGPAVYLSSDGVDWRRIGLPDPTGRAREIEPAGIADNGRVIVVFGFTSDPTAPVVWVVSEAGEAEQVDGTPFGSGTRLTAAASGPGGLMAALQTDTGPPLPRMWRSDDGVAWSPTPVPFPDGEQVSGLIGGIDGYTAMVGERGGDEFSVWISEDGTDWHRRADQESVFALLSGKSGPLYPALAAEPAADSGTDGSRPIAFAFNGFWLEIPVSYEGRRFVAVAVAADENRRVASGVEGTGSDLQAQVLVADP